MTFRAVCLGLLGAVFIAAFGYLNDHILLLTHLVGNHLPISVFGVLILLVIAVNPLLARLGGRWKLAPSELAVAVALMLAGCSIPGSSLMRSHMQVLAMPIQMNQARPGWRAAHLLDYVPPQMLPADGRYDPQVMDGFLMGLRQRGRPIGLDQVPWAQWRGPLTTWMPLVVLMSLAAICLAMIVHPQWARRERLRYPIAEFATVLMGDDERAGEPIFRQRLFWLGLGILLAIRVVNGLHSWFPDSLSIPLSFDLSPVAQKWPRLREVPNAGPLLLRLDIFPIVVAFAFFLSSEVSFSLGISELLFVLISVALFGRGVEASFHWLAGGGLAYQRFGSYLGMAIMLAYAGRRHYLGVLRAALTFRAAPSVERYTVWACRAFLLCAGGMAALLAWHGLDWPLAVLLVALMMLMYLVIARIIAETGLFYVEPWWQPAGVLFGLMGYAALGPHSIVVLGLACAVLCINPRECLMPFVTTALKITEDTGVRPARTGPAMGAVFVLALAVAVPVVFWANYNYGAAGRAWWIDTAIPQMPYEITQQAVNELRASGQLAASEALGTWGRLAAARPSPAFLWGTGIGLGLVVLLSVLRLRLAWWPIHPVLLLVWGTNPLGMFSDSFLLGWMVKSATVALGGSRAFRKGKALMIGVIAGDLLGGLLFMGIGATYYFVTGLRPP